MRRCWGSRFFERESNHGVMGVMRSGGKLGVAVSIHIQIREWHRLSSLFLVQGYHTARSYFLKVCYIGFLWFNRIFSLSFLLRPRSSASSSRSQNDAFLFVISA